MGALVCGCGLQTPAPKLHAVTPAATCDSGTRTLTLAGADFAAVPTGTLAGAPVLVAPRVVVQPPTGAPLALDDAAAGGATPVRWVNGAELQVDAPLDQAAAGTASVTVENPDGRSSTLAQAFEILASPHLTAVTPAQICATGGTVMLTGSALVAGATVTLRDPASGTTVDAKTTVSDDGHATAVFGANTFPRSAPLDLTITDPNGCAATLAGAVRVRPGNGGCP
jgi:hypothetical protein